LAFPPFRAHKEGLGCRQDLVSGGSAIAYLRIELDTEGAKNLEELVQPDPWRALLQLPKKDVRHPHGAGRVILPEVLRFSDGTHETPDFLWSVEWNFHKYS